MSNLSILTALAEMDPTLGDNIDIRKQICVLVTTRGDSTLLDHSSFNKQDVVELCVGLDQEHPEGVLQLLDTEAVLAFWHNTNMMAIMHHLMAA